TTDLVLDRGFQTAGLESLGDRCAAVARATARLADREPRAFDVSDHTGLDELRGRIGDATDDACRIDRAGDDPVRIDGLQHRAFVRAAERLEEPPRHAVLGR